MNWFGSNGLVTRRLNGIGLGKLKIKDQVAFFNSVHEFLKSGFTLGEALKFYSVVHPRLSVLIKEIQAELASGKSFSDSLRPLISFRIDCQLKIAEFHGDLLTALKNVSDFLKLKRRQQQKIKGLLVYPVFLLIFLVGIITGIRLLVTPQLQSGNDGSGHLSVRWLGLALVPVLVGIYGVWRYYREQPRVWQINVILKVPLVGKVYQAYYAYYFASNLALMMNCGMDLKRIVGFMASFHDSPLIQDLSRDVKRTITRGRSLDQIRFKYRFLPRNMMILLDSGDTVDVMAEKLKTYAKFEFKLMLKRSSRVISLLQPAMFLIIGLVITGTYLSMLLPMYQSIKGVY